MAHDSPRPIARLKRYLVEAGARVEVHRPVAEVETGLAIVVIPAHRAGVAAVLPLRPGDRVPDGPDGLDRLIVIR